MIEVQKINTPEGPNRYRVFIDGVELPNSSSYIPTRSVNNEGLRAHVYGESSPLVMARHFSDISTRIRQLSFTVPPLLSPDIDLRADVERSGDEQFTINLRCDPDAANWKHLWSVKEYIEEFRQGLEKTGDSGIEWLKYEEDFPFTPAFILRLPIVADATLEIGASVLKYASTMSRLHELTEASLQSKVQHPGVERIIRSIEFPPEYHRSGVAILSYFADVLRHKNLSEDVKVSIEQNGLNVSLVIESPTGQREEVERTLEAYALVVTGRRPIETLTTDPYEVAELKNELRIAKARIETQRDLLAAKESDVSELRTEVRRVARQSDEDRARFMALIEGLVSHNTDLSAGFKELAQRAQQAHNSALAGALENIYKVVERGVREEDREEVLQNLTTIQQQDPGVFKRVSNILVSGAISGAAGNYLYAWLQFLIGSLPK